VCVCVCVCVRVCASDLVCRSIAETHLIVADLIRVIEVFVSSRARTRARPEMIARPQWRSGCERDVYCAVATVVWESAQGVLCS
jgi:hypothetical protein